MRNHNLTVKLWSNFFFEFLLEFLCKLKIIIQTINHNNSNKTTEKVVQMLNNSLILTVRAYWLKICRWNIFLEKKGPREIFVKLLSYGDMSSWGDFAWKHAGLDRE